MSEQRSVHLSRRGFLGGVAASAGAAILAACGGSSATDTPKPAATTAGSAATTGSSPTTAPAQASGGKKKSVLFWGRQQFLPESNDYLTESVQLAGQKGGFDVTVQLFSNDEHPQKEVVAMESGVVPDITYTYAPALWNQNGYAMDVQPLYDEIGKTGGGWLDLADGNSKVAIGGKRIAVPMNNEPWFTHLRKDMFEDAGYQIAVHLLRSDDGSLQEGQQARPELLRLRWPDDRGGLGRQRPSVHVDVRRAALR